VEEISCACVFSKAFVPCMGGFQVHILVVVVGFSFFPVLWRFAFKSFHVCMVGSNK